MQAIYDAHDNDTLPQVWDMVVKGVETEPLQRHGKVGDEPGPYQGHGGPVRCKFVEARWRRQLKQQLLGPQLRS